MLKTVTKDDFLDLIEEIRSLPNYKDPIFFGIYKEDGDFLVANENKNFSSAAIFTQALIESNKSVDFSQNELIFDIDKQFINSALDGFNTFIQSNELDKHQNIKTILKLQNLTGYKIILKYS